MVLDSKFISSSIFGPEQNRRIQRDAYMLIKIVFLGEGFPHDKGTQIPEEDTSSTGPFTGMNDFREG